MSACPLCNPPAELVFLQGKLVIGVWAAPAVTPGHAVLLTRRHVTDWFAASPAEQQELMASLTTVRDAILEQHLPDGFNIGIHIGAAAGQDVPHLHVDVIPRYRQAAAGEAQTDRAPRKQTDVWSGEAPEPDPAQEPVSAPVADPVLDRVERELEAEARQRPVPAPGGGKVTQLPGTRRPAPGIRLEPTPGVEPPHPQTRPRAGLSAVPAPADEPEDDGSAAADEPAEPSSAYIKAPSFRSLDDGYEAPYDDDDLYDDEGETRLPGRGKKWVVLLVLLLLAGGGGYAAYWAKTSPYIGEPPAHLTIDPNQRKPAPAAVKATVERDAGMKTQQLPAAPRGRSSLAPVRTIPGTTTPAPGAAAPGAAAPGTATPGTPATPGAVAPANNAYDRLMAEASELLKQGKRRAAYKLLDKALEVQPDGWQALQHLAWRDAKAGRLGRALKRARAALKVNKDAPYANLVLGVAMHERGRTAAARAGYSKFLQHCKGCPEAGEISRVLRSMRSAE